MAELAGTIIPKQRMDRLIDFTRALEVKIGSLDQDTVRAKLTDENFTDLLEESARQATQAVTQERRQYLASLMAAGVTTTHISHVESRHILRLLSQINDLEVIWLRFYAYPYHAGDDDFRTKNSAVLAPVRATLASDQKTLDQRALQENYVEHLISLGLLSRPLQMDPKTGQPVFNRSRKEWKTQGPETTPLGLLLLRHIGLIDGAGRVLTAATKEVD